MNLKFSKKLRQYSKSNPIGLFYISIALLVFSLVILGLAYRVEHTNQKNSLYGRQQNPYKVSQKVSMGVVGISVDSVSYNDGSQPFVAPADKHYAIIMVSITNKSDKPIQILPSLDMYTKDASGNVVYLTPFALADPFRSGPLSPGEKIRGEVSFLVPKTSNNRLIVDADWSGGVLPFALP